MGFIEKLLPDTIPLTEEQFKTFVEQTIATEHSRRILDGLTAQNAAAAPAQGAGTAGRGKHPASLPPKPPRQRRRIEESVSFTSEQIDLYERVNLFLIHPKEHIIIDYWCFPVCDGKYSLVWDRDTVTLSVFDGFGKNDTISVTLSGH